MPTQITDLRPFIRDVVDWPKLGIVFKDITPLLNDGKALASAIEQMTAPFRDQGIEIVCGAESRGFIFGTALAQTLGAGFVPIRKPRKLPSKTRSISYSLEYGTDTLEVHADAVKPRQKVLMVDDLLATGGTMKACCDLITELGGNIVGISVLIELTFLYGRNKMGGKHPIHSVIQYAGE